MNYAGIDIGTNSCRLLISRISEGQMHILCRDITTTRIGRGLSASGNISPEAADRTLECLLRYQSRIQQADTAEYRMVATSAVREAANRTWFEELCRRKLRQPLEIISGEEEARLTYMGVQKGLQVAAPILVADLGGGSTELIYARGGEYFAQSLPLGAVRGTEEQITDSQILSAMMELKPRRDLLSDAVLVFCGGTATSAVAMKFGLTAYDSRRVHGQRLNRSEISHACEYLRGLPLEKRRAVAGLQPGRADIIVAGLMIMLDLMLALGKEWALVSESDLLEGLIWEMAVKQSG